MCLQLLRQRELQVEIHSLLMLLSATARLRQRVSRKYGKRFRNRGMEPKLLEHHRKEIPRYGLLCRRDPL